MTSATWPGTSWIAAWLRRFRQDLPVVGDVYTDRVWSYDLFDAYANNVVYQPYFYGGQREQLNMILGNAETTDLAGLYNPVARAVGLYQHVFGGGFGADIVVQSDNPILVAPPKQPGQARAPMTPLERIWRWSVMDQTKQRLCRLAATHGNVGLRIVAENGLSPRKRRVWIKAEHPKIIRDVELDDRGNVVDIELEYHLMSGLGDAQTVETIRERQTKDRFQTWTVVNQVLEPREQFLNELGVVPYVLLAHEPGDDLWGRNCFYRAMTPIDRLNALLVHINTQIHRHVKAKWFIAASGAAPASIDLDDLSVAYVDQRANAIPPVIEPLVAKLSLADAIAQAAALQSQIEDELPELKATAGKFLANQSGETVAQLRRPAEDRLALARINYEDALVRAQQIGLSLGVLYGLWELGTGTGTREAADRAYQDGYEDHAFNARELLPLSEADRVALVTAKQAAGWTRRQALLDAGVEPALVETMLADSAAAMPVAPAISVREVT